MTSKAKPSTRKSKDAAYRSLREKIGAYSHLEEKIILQLMLTLHEKRLFSIDDIYALARKEAKDFKYDQETGSPNVSPEKWSGNERRIIRRLTLKSALEHFTADEIEDLIMSVVKRDYIFSLENIANLTDISFGILADKVKEYSAIPLGTPLPKEDVMGLRVSLLRHFISDQLEFLRVAKHHLTIRDMAPLVDTTIGSAAGHGRIGGKAAGMLLGYKILTETLTEKYGDLIRIPESYYVRTDVFEDFLTLNGLMRYQHQKYKTAEEVRNEYPAIQEVFRNGQFPDYMVEQCRAMLKKVGKHPVIVRSNSLLEDNFKAAFSGKYQSVFLGNQGNLDQRLSQLLVAIGEVYASGLAPDPIAYRKERNLLDYDEKIGILIQKVVGFKYRHYFLPAYAGVALSRNDYTWSSRIREEDGLVRLVMGLGTRAVDRVGDDYPRLVGLTAPTLRPETTLAAQKKYTQHFVDVVNLKTNSYEVVPLKDLWGDEQLPLAEQMLSIEEDGYLQTPFADLPPSSYPSGVITFDRLLRYSPFPELLRDILREVEAAYGCPVDIEFSHDGKHFYLLQTRPMAQRMPSATVELPGDVPEGQVLFRAREHIHNGRIDNIDYLIYCDPLAYTQMATPQMRYQLARLVGKINNHLADKNFILMGPGRWGSSNINLGIPVQYSEINNTRALIEIAYREGDYTPGVSFGTHFFLDLVEKGIHYLPLYPDDNEGNFNSSFFADSLNELTTMMPGCEDFTDYLKIIDTRTAGPGSPLNLWMNGKSQQALAFYENQS